MDGRVGMLGSILFIQSCIFYTWNCTLGWLHVRIISLVLISVVQLIWVPGAKDGCVIYLKWPSI